MTTESVAPPLAPVTTTPQRRGFTVAFVLANLGYWLAFFTPIILTLQVQAARLVPGNPEGAVSLVLGVGAVFGIVTNPIAGVVSDRTTSRFGMRRPWLVGYVVVGFVGLAVQALAPGLAVLVVGGILSQIGFSGGLSVLMALLSDQFPAERRGKVSGLLGVSQAVATLGGAALAGALSASPAAAFVVPGAIGVGLVVLLCVLLRDRTLDPADRPLREPFWATFWISPRQHPDFGWAWLSRFAFFLALAGVMNYQLFYLTSQLAVPAAEAAGLVGVGIGLQVVFLVISSAIAGTLSDRIGRRRPFVVAAGGVGVAGLILLAVATSLPVWAVGMALVGVSSGMYFSVDLALVADVLPDRDTAAAKNFGLFNIANQLPQTLAPAMAPLFLAISFGSVGTGGPNYTMFFTACAVIAVVSAVTILPVRGVR